MVRLGVKMMKRLKEHTARSDGNVANLWSPKRFAREFARWAFSLPDTVALTSDLGSARRLAGALSPFARSRTGTSEVRLEALGGMALQFRRGATDAPVIWGSFTFRQHLPQYVDPSVIWDVGANIGATTAHYATLFPRAAIVAVEPDPGNAKMARANLAPFGARCVVVEAALWHDDGDVAFHINERKQWASRIVPAEAPVGTRVRAVSPATLIREAGIPDFVKLDIEGAEAKVLGAANWPPGIKEISVECHKPYSITQCRADLERRGYMTDVFKHGLGYETVVARATTTFA